MMGLSLLRFFLPLVVALFFSSAVKASGQEGNRVAASAWQIRPLLPGTRVPAVTFFKTDGTPFDLSEAVARKPTILIFYRGGW